MFGRITDDEASMASATFSTPKTEGKRRSSVTPKRERMPEEYSIETPERRRMGRAESSPPSVVHPTMAATLGDNRDPLRDSRLAGLESVSELYGKCKDDKERMDQTSVQVNSMHQELLDLAVKVGNAEQQIKKSTETAAAAGKIGGQINGRVDKLVGQVARVSEMASDSSAQLTAARAMAEEALGDTARRGEEIRDHSGRITTLESSVEELSASARVVRDRVGEIERIYRE